MVETSAWRDETWKKITVDWAGEKLKSNVFTIVKSLTDLIKKFTSKPDASNKINFYDCIKHENLIQTSKFPKLERQTSKPVKVSIWELNLKPTTKFFNTHFWYLTQKNEARVNTLPKLFSFHFRGFIWVFEERKNENTLS